MVLFLQQPLRYSTFPRVHLNKQAGARAVTYTGVCFNAFVAMRG
ncbi:hypothetical protein SBC1_42840 (plasmid) [Caballeronia sp. SBC1]|nr:hypothetical protein SBC2_45090 [Caballeronia sp. SBC2]QIN64244.1 hypothetical protein SBC1_42840 [Caballeronia sp. SBC1]